jgi:AcrR family transcriptional regulator
LEYLFDLLLPLGMPTTSPTSPPRTYHVHRERQRRRILEAAEKLFDEHGIDRVTMTEIISASGLRTSTIYHYFSSKDDIVWAILEDVLADLATRAKITIDREKTALAKITALLELMADDLTRNQAKVRFLAQFDAMYARNWPAERLLTLEAQIMPEGFRHFSRLIRKGIADGSLRADLDPELTMHAVMNAVVGAQRRLASLGGRVELEYGQPIDSLFRETIRLILLGLRATREPRNVIRSH